MMPDSVQRIVVAAFLTRGEACLLAKRAGNKRLAPGKWHLPGGHVEFAESPREALKRELTEEFGVEVVVGMPVWTFSYLWETEHTVGIVYRARLVPSGQVLRWSEAEFQACEWVTEARLASYVPMDDHNFLAAKAGFRIGRTLRQSGSRIVSCN